MPLRKRCLNVPNVCLGRLLKCVVVCPRSERFEISLIFSASIDLNSIPNFLKKIIQNFNIEKKYRVGVRGSTKDRMPFFCSLNSIQISKNTKNEYLLGGMGSWGFIYAPLYAEFLIKSLLSEPLVINSNLERLLGVNRLL